MKEIATSWEFDGQLAQGCKALNKDPLGAYSAAVLEEVWWGHFCAGSLIEWSFPVLSFCSEDSDRPLFL